MDCEEAKQVDPLKKSTQFTPGLRAMIYSYLPLGTLMQTVCKLNKQERQLLIENQLVNQPRSLTITLKEYTYEADQIDYKGLSYLLKLVNKEVTLKLSFYSERDMFLVNVIYNKLFKKKLKTSSNQNY